MRLRNNIFAAAFDELKRRGVVKNQKELAQKMGVSEDTITRILKDRTEVTEDAITKLQTASGCIFNLQWLRGQDADHMFIDDLAEPHKSESIDLNLYKQLLEARDESNRDLRSLNERLQSMVEDRDTTITELNERIEDMTQQLTDAVAHVDHYKQLVAERERETERLKVQMDDIRIAEVEKQNYLEKLNSIIADKDATIAEKKKTIADRDTTLLDLRAIITTLKTEIKAYQEDPFHRYPHPIGVADEGDKSSIKQPNVSPNEK